MEEQLKIILEQLRDIQKRVDDIDQGLTRDRERLQDFNIRLEHVETEIKETRKAINSSSTKIKNAVADVTEPVVGAVDSFRNEIEKKKVITIRPMSWWNKLWHPKE